MKDYVAEGALRRTKWRIDPKYRARVLQTRVDIRIDPPSRLGPEARSEQARERRYSKEPPQAIPYEECLRRLLNRQRTVMA